MKLYIVGCAKTGTTLLQRLFCAFHATTVVPGEKSIGHVINCPNQGVQVFKRTVGTIFSNIASDKKIVEHVALARARNIKFVVMHRNREAVLASSGGAVSAARYDACEDQLSKYRKHVSYVVHYEFMVSNPDIEQQAIARHFGLSIKHKFSEYPDFVPDEFFRYIKDPRYAPRRIGAPWEPEKRTGRNIEQN